MAIFHSSVREFISNAPLIPLHAWRAKSRLAVYSFYLANKTDVLL
jgi:hypothetical protein